MEKKLRGVKSARAAFGWPEIGVHRAQWSAMLICLTAIGGAQASSYIENGKAGDPASWRSGCPGGGCRADENDASQG